VSEPRAVSRFPAVRAPSLDEAREKKMARWQKPFPAHRRSIFGSKTPAPQVPLEPVNVNSARQVRTNTRPPRSRGPFVRAVTPHAPPLPASFGKIF